MALPSIAVVSCSDSFSAEDLVKQVLGSEGSADESVTSEDGVESFPWRIDNKYYSASVRLCPLRSKSLVSREFGESVQAFLAYFDASQKGALAQVSEWLSFSQHWAPSVLVLVCDRIDEQGVSRREAQEWCIQSAFELVELSPLEALDEDDDFPETTGIKRIIQALSAHVWPNLQMKERTAGGMLSCALGALEGRRAGPGTHRQVSGPPPPRRPRRHLYGLTLTHRHNSVRPPTIAQLKSMLQTDIQELAALTTADSADCENFERLYEKLREMKDRAVTMPHGQRKVHAEKVAKAFWMAIGGDLDEIDGLSSGED
ncbi:unnamed protein product [Lampetra fluviatilis]